MLWCISCSRPIQMSTARVIKSCLAIIVPHWLIIVLTDMLQGANWALLDLPKELEVVIIFLFLLNMISILHRSLIDGQMNREPVKNEVTAEWSVKQMIITILFIYLFLNVSHMSCCHKNTCNLFVKKCLCCVNQSINQSLSQLINWSEIVLRQVVQIIKSQPQIKVHDYHLYFCVLV